MVFNDGHLSKSKVIIMRCAAILPYHFSIVGSGLSPYILDNCASYHGVVCSISFHNPLANFRENFGVKINRFLDKIRKFSSFVSEPVLYGCTSIGPHNDEVIGDYTVGFVIDGSGMLFTGNGRNVGMLQEGNVYLLENKKLHGLKECNGPMVFATIDFAAESIEHANALVELSLLECGAIRQLL